MRLILIFLGLISIANLACAGAWPRDKGQLFIAAGGNFLLSDGAQLPVYYDPTVYAEYGLSERLTVGMYLYTADAGRVGSIFFFASFPIGDLQSQQKFAAILSLGARANTITESARWSFLGHGPRKWLVVRRCIRNIWHGRQHIPPENRCNLWPSVDRQVDDVTATANRTGDYERLLRQNRAVGDL